MTCSHGPLPPSLICDSRLTNHYSNTASPERSRSASLNESALLNLTERTQRAYKLRQVGLSVNSDYDNTNFPEDLSLRPFPEFFFQAVPLVIHPIIILRVLCHRMFGNMLRRKSRYSAQNLSPPLIVESDTCPPRSLSSEADLDKNGDLEDHDRTGNLLTSGRSGKRKGNLHVQITTPTPTTPPADTEDMEEVIRQMRRRTKRAGSMDKHLMRMGSIRKRGNRTMSLAIKAIGESLVTPLDLNISPPAQASDHDVSGSANSRTMSVKKNIFRFPSVKAKTKQISKSHDYLAALGQSLEDESLSPKSSAASLNCEEKDIRDFQRELINLPTFEVDTHRMDQCTSPLLSRSNSVPEHLGTLLVPSALDKSPSVCQISVTEASEEVRQHHQVVNPMVLTLPRHHPQQQNADTYHQHHPRVDGSSRTNLALPISADCGNNMDDSSDFHPGDIVVKFAAATPMESPASNIDEPLSPLLPPKGSSSTPQGSLLEQHLSQLSLTQQQQQQSEQLRSPTFDSNHLAVTPNMASSIFLGSGMSISPSTSSFQSEFTCRSLNVFSATPSMDIPPHHAGVMTAIEMWVDVCPLDLESTPLMKREMKDFLHKMAGLGAEYKHWSLRISDKLNLEVSCSFNNTF